ncbi:MAG: S41 family peptidase [Ignavibacteria bacterium]
MNRSGYKRFPTLNEMKVVFVCEDDLWEVHSSGGVARRLTSNSGEVTNPYFSPDGRFIAFSGKEEGEKDVYIIPSEGGANKRLTFLGKNTKVTGWSADSKYVLFSSDANQPFSNRNELYRISVKGGLQEKMPYGVANNISYGPNGGIILGRNTLDPARWKRYKGGTAGVFWIDKKGSGKFQRFLKDIQGNLGSPMWINERIYFISDHEGLGKIYSCNVRGEDLKCNSNNNEYYVRNATTDGRNIVYHAGAEIFIYNTKTGEEKEIEVEYYSPQIQKQRKFIEADKFLENYTLNPDGSSLIITSRGRSFSFSNWEGPVLEIGKTNGARYRLTEYLKDKQSIVTISDEGGSEAIEIQDIKNGKKNIRKLSNLDIGIGERQEVSPKENKIALSNNRQELFLIDLDKETSIRIARSYYERIVDFTFSPDGKWLVYSLSDAEFLSSLYLYNINKNESNRITNTGFRDFQPVFDPDGKFIYFLSQRNFNPVYDSSYFQLGFPLGSKPYLISLKKETRSPFTKEYTKYFSGEERNSNTDKKEKKDIKIDVDMENIEDRIIEFPVPEAQYLQIAGIRNGILLSQRPIKGALEREPWDSSADGILEKFSYFSQGKEKIAKEVSNFKMSLDGKSLLYRSKNKLFLKSDLTEDADHDHNESDTKKSSRIKSGWIDLTRVKVNLDPMCEWKQMYSESWRLQKEHYWNADMSGIDWNLVYKRYLPLLEKVASRSEFSDVIWEMQGELGTSHAYEMGGDYRLPPNYKLGHLSANYEYDTKENAYKISHIVKGDPWKNTSPFKELGVEIKEGDFITSVNGENVSKEITPDALLVNKSGSIVSVGIKDAETKKSRNVNVKAVANDTPARYREWVERNRAYVSKKSDGKLGYVHIPDMMSYGFSEFHRHYIYEVNKSGLIVDVRNNRGGHVSQILLEILSRKRIGFGLSRYGNVESYPNHSTSGTLVALTDEYSGSDGDIFSHNFKQMKLGILVGKRTWGGVIGINPRLALSDGSVTTQPEYATYMNDVGWAVENYGTDPDIEVDITPQDYAVGKDPQMDKAITVALSELRKNPVKLPKFDKRPMLKLPLFEISTNGNGSHKKTGKPVNS